MSAGELQKPLPAPEVILIGLLAAFVVLLRALWEMAEPFRDRGTRERARARRDCYRAHSPWREDRWRRAAAPRIWCLRPVAGTALPPSSATSARAPPGSLRAGLISTGRMYAVLWLGLLLLAVMLVTVRNFFGGIVIITGGVLFYLVLRYGTARVEETAVAYGVAWFLLISGTRVALRILGRPGGSEGRRGTRRHDFRVALGVVLAVAGRDSRCTCVRRKNPDPQLRRVMNWPLRARISAVLFSRAIYGVSSA